MTKEIGGEVGPKWLLDQGLTKPDYAIAAGFSYAVVNATQRLPAARDHRYGQGRRMPRCRRPALTRS